MRGTYYRWNKKQTTDEGLTLPTTHLRDGLNHVVEANGDGSHWGGVLQWSRVGTGEVTSSIGYTLERRGAICLVRFRYTTTRRSGEKIESDYRVPVTWTVPNYGGRRWWWICPLTKNGQVCGRRVGKLYLPHGATYFGCRHCHDLTYESTRGDLTDAIDNRMIAIRRKLGGGKFLDPPKEKPKWMHWGTYGKLCREWWNLWQLRELAFTLRVAELTGALSSLAPAAGGELGADVAEFRQDVDAEWRQYKQHPDAPPLFGRPPRRFYDPDLELARLEYEAEEEERRRRGTLGEIAKAAGVPYDFAREAQSYGLIRPDGGRGARRKRYRRKLSSWLEKLHLLNQAGYSWEDLQDWTRRRFEPGHEHERRWPDGFREMGADGLGTQTERG